MNSDIKVKTVTVHDDEYQSVFDRVLKFIATDFEKDFKLRKNYSLGKLKFDKQLAVSYYESDNRIVGFSTVMYTDTYVNSVRILNRFLKSPHYRFVNQSKMKSVVTAETQEMLKQQIDVAEKFGYDFAFMSREGKMPRSNMQHFVKSMPWIDWHIPEGRYRVCPGDETCWQQICIAPVNKNYEIKMEHMSEEQFNENYKK